MNISHNLINNELDYTPLTEEEQKELDRIVAEIDEKIKKEALKDKYSKFFEPKTEEAVRKKMESMPENHKTGMFLLHGDSKIELEIPVGAITVVGARTSHGKTTFLMNLALNLANKIGDKTIHFYSYEESEEIIILKLLNIFINKEFREDRKNLDYIKGYYRSTGETYRNNDFLTGKEIFFKTLMETGRIKVHYDALDIDELIQIIELAKEFDNAGVIIIDYLQKIPPKKEYYTKQGTRQLILQEITKKLADTAVRTGLPIITASQLNRQVTSKEELDLNRLREAGDIEQDANLVIGLWKIKNEDDISLVDQNISKLYVEVLKNRDGITGMHAELLFNGNTGKISNAEDFAGFTDLEE